VIRKYGATHYCFAFELGRLSNYGEGVIALESPHYRSKHIYAHVNDIVEKTFFDLLIQVSGHNQNNKSQRERSLSSSHSPHLTLPIINNLNKSQKQYESDNYYNTQSSSSQTLNNSSQSFRQPSSTSIEIRDERRPSPSTSNFSNTAAKKKKPNLSIYKAVVLSNSDPSPAETVSSGRVYGSSNASPRLRSDLINNTVEFNVVDACHPNNKWTIMHNNVINLNHVDSSSSGDEDDRQAHYYHNHEIDEADECCYHQANHNTSNQNHENADDDEYDETVSFYEEKYVPMYMSNRNLVSSAIEYFVEDDNAIYGRVQL
jgi:hypothetical protein